MARARAAAAPSGRGIDRLIVRVEELSEADLSRALRRRTGASRLAGVVPLVSATLLMLLRGGLLLVASWRLIVLELIPAVWLAVILWDWRYHTVQGRSLVELSGWGAAAAAGVIVVATLLASTCNVAFAFAALGDPTDVGAALRAGWLKRRPIVVVSLSLAALHAWVSVRGAAIGVGAFAIGMGLVVGATMYSYTALPAYVVGVRVQRPTARERIARTVATGAVSLVAATPGFVLSRIGQLLLAISVTRPLGVVVLGVAVLVQVAGVSSSRAVAVSSGLLAVAEPSPMGHDQPETTAEGRGVDEGGAAHGPGRR